MRKPDIPFFKIEQTFLETLNTQKRLVLTVPTGSGKSTQVPLLLDGGLRTDVAHRVGELVYWGSSDDAKE